MSGNVLIINKIIPKNFHISKIIFIFTIHKIILVMSAQYHFIKIADKDNPDKGTWYFKPTSISDIMEHWNVFAKNAFKTGMQEHLKNLFG